MTPTLTDARRNLADAQAAVKAAAEAQAKVREHHSKITAVIDRHTELRAQLEQAQQAHSQALVNWAAAGAAGDAPSPPATTEKLARDVAAAERAANAAEQAAKAYQAEIDKAAQVCADALQNLRHARRAVLAEVAVPMIAEYRDAKARTESMLQHVFGLQAIARELRDEVPGIADLTGRIAEAMNFRPVLAPGGAQASRDAWKRLVADLFDDPTATLGAAPGVIDPDAHVARKEVA